mmetsp:Transcript_9185/g.19084  ORF Transcript_9185/g.19084 Transcript_9185/m.19084 type:complete len:212 (+) Transcript_9185:292-927(+)
MIPTMRITLRKTKPLMPPRMLVVWALEGKHLKSTRQCGRATTKKKPLSTPWQSHSWKMLLVVLQILTMTPTKTGEILIPMMMNRKFPKDPIPKMMRVQRRNHRRRVKTMIPMTMRSWKMPARILTPRMATHRMNLTLKKTRLLLGWGLMLLAITTMIMMLTMTTIARAQTEFSSETAMIRKTKKKLRRPRNEREETNPKKMFLQMPMNTQP